MANFRKNQLFSFFRYTGDALVFTFLIRFFNSLDFNDLMTGTLLASIPLLAIVGNLTIGLLSRNIKRNLTLMKILMPIETLGICLIGFFSNFYIVLLLSVMINFCNSSFYSLLDSTSSKIAANCKKNYANIRIFGSIAYLFGSLSGGFLIKWIDYSFVFLIGGGIYFLGYLILLLIDKSQFSSEKRDRLKKGGAKELLHNMSFMLYRILCAHFRHEPRHR